MVAESNLMVARLSTVVVTREEMTMVNGHYELQDEDRDGYHVPLLNLGCHECNTPNFGLFYFMMLSEFFMFYYILKLCDY